MGSLIRCDACNQEFSTFLRWDRGEFKHTIVMGKDDLCKTCSDKINSWIVRNEPLEARPETPEELAK